MVGGWGGGVWGGVGSGKENQPVFQRKSFHDPTLGCISGVFGSRSVFGSGALKLLDSCSVWIKQAAG